MQPVKKAVVFLWGEDYLSWFQRLRTCGKKRMQNWHRWRQFAGVLCVSNHTVVAVLPPPIQPVCLLFRHAL